MTRTTTLICAFLCTLAACGDGAGSAGPGAGTFIGTVPGTNAYVVIVTDGTEVRGYVCDGTSQGVSIAQWFKGTATAAGAVDLPSNSGEARLTATIGAASVAGTVRLPDNRTIGFQAPRASGEAGLYAYKNPAGTVIAGWIVPNGGAPHRGSVLIGTSLTFSTLTLTSTTSTATLPGIGTVTTGRVTPGNLAGFQMGGTGWP